MRKKLLLIYRQFFAITYTYIHMKSYMNRRKRKFDILDNHVNDDELCKSNRIWK